MPKVLVVDDSVSVRKVVERVLEARKIQVLSAATGGEAFDRIERDEPDAVVCDVLLPDKDGYKVCEFIRNHPRLARTPVLLISGIVNSTVLQRAAEVRSNDVMFKPFNADELGRKIDQLLASVGAATSAPAPAPVAAPVAPVSLAPPAKRVDVNGGKDGTVSLGQFATMPGVRSAVLVDREGFLIESVGDGKIDPEVSGALAACLAESSDGIGHELGQGRLHGAILEYETGTMLIHAVGAGAMLAVAVGDPTALGKVRYYVKKLVPELARGF